MLIDSVRVPQLYCVRPNSGRVEPGQSIEVQGESCASSKRATYPQRSCYTLCGGAPVMLQAMKEEPPLAAKCKDKFLIQSTTITPEKETLSLADIVSSSSLPLFASCHLNFLVSRNVFIYVMTM
jgi:vesicle-associated membrane protein-associated protein A